MCAEYIDIFSPGRRLFFSLPPHPNNFGCVLGAMDSEHRGTRPSCYISSCNLSVLKNRSPRGNLTRLPLAGGQGGFQSIHCRLLWKGDRVLLSHLVSAEEHRNAHQDPVPVTPPKGTCASSTNWTQFLFKSFAVHVHLWSLWRNRIRKRLQFICWPLVWSLLVH